MADSPRPILIGVSGGIAAFKTASLVSRLVQSGRRVRVILTADAQRFIGPATFAALCGEPPVTEIWDGRFPLGSHIELAAACGQFVIAPATARVIASLSAGDSADLLATTYLCFPPESVLLAPAMSDVMWRHPAVQRNLQQLQADGVRTIGPENGWLSCRRQGAGRMAEPDQILSAIASHPEA